MLRLRFVILVTIAGLLAGCAIAFLDTPTYTSYATLRVSPGVVSEHYVPSRPVADMASFIRLSGHAILARAVLVTMIVTNDLYPGERRRMPMEDVVELMRGNIRMTPRPDGTLEIAFTGTDRYQAQRVTSDITSRLIEYFFREDNLRSRATETLLRDHAETAAQTWRKFNDQLRTSSKADERLQLDRDLARKEYIDLKAKLAEIGLVGELEKRRLGSTLEVLDPATLPARANSSRALIVIVGALAGLVIGLLIDGARRFRLRRAPLLAV